MFEWLRRKRKDLRKGPKPEPEPGKIPEKVQVELLKLAAELGRSPESLLQEYQAIREGR